MSKSLSNSPERFTSLADYIARSGKRKGFVARVELDVEPYRFTALLNPDTYQPRVDDELVARIAKLLNQPFNYVRKQFPKVA